MLQQRGRKTSRNAVTTASENSVLSSMPSTKGGAVSTERRWRSADREYCNKGRKTNNGKSYASIQSKFTSISSSHAAIALGPYAYVVRQPDAKEIPETFERFLGVNKMQNQQHRHQLKVEVPRESSDIRHTETENENEREVLWISPIASPRYEQSVAWQDTSMSSDALAVSPQPNPPLCNSYGVDTTHSDVPRGWDAQRECTTKPSPQVSTRLLAELLHRMQRRLNPEHKLSLPCPSYDAGTKKSNFGNAPNQREEKEAEEYNEKQKHERHVSKTPSSLHSHVKADTCHISPTCVERPPYNRALEFAATNPRYTERQFHDSEGLPASKSSPHTNRSGPDTLEWGDKLWHGIKEDDERLYRWFAERGVCPNGDVLALRVFTDYLKKKVSRIEDDCNKLFWSSRQSIPPLHNMDSKRTSLGILGGERENPPKLQKLGHPYGSSEATNLERQENRRNFLERSRNGTGIPLTFSKNSGKKDDAHIFSGTTVADDDKIDSHQKGRSMGSSGALPLGSHRHSSEKVRKCRFRGSVPSFYTGKSLAAEIDTKEPSRGIARKDTEENSPSVSTSSSSSCNEKPMYLHHHASKRQEEKHDAEQPTLQRDRKTERVISPKLWDEAITPPENSSALQPPVNRLPPSGAVVHPLTLPNPTDVHDTSAVLRLRNYCDHLENERDSLLHGKPAYTKQKVESVDAAPTAAGKETTRHRHVSQNHHNGKSTVHCSVTSVSSPSLDGRVVPLSTHHDGSQENHPRPKVENEEMTIAHTKRISSGTAESTTLTPPPPPTASVSCQTDAHIEKGAPLLSPQLPSVTPSRYISPGPYEPHSLRSYGVPREMEQSHLRTVPYLRGVDQSLRRNEVTNPLSMNVSNNTPVDAPPLQEEGRRTNVSSSWSVGSNTSRSFFYKRPSVEDNAGMTKSPHDSNSEESPIGETDGFATPDAPLSLTDVRESLPNQFSRVPHGQNLHLGKRKTFPASPVKSSKTPLLQDRWTPSKIWNGNASGAQSGTVVYSSSGSSRSGSNSNSSAGVGHRLDGETRFRHLGQRFGVGRSESPITVTGTPAPDARMVMRNPMSSPLNINNMYAMARGSNVPTRGETTTLQQSESSGNTDKKVHGFIVRVFSASCESNDSKDRIASHEGVIVSRSRRFGMHGHKG